MRLGVRLALTVIFEVPLHSQARHFQRPGESGASVRRAAAEQHIRDECHVVIARCREKSIGKAPQPNLEQTVEDVGGVAVAAQALEKPNPVTTGSTCTSPRRQANITARQGVVSMSSLCPHTSICSREYVRTQTAASAPQARVSIRQGVR